MKKFYSFLIFNCLVFLVSAQIPFENKTLVDKEIGNYMKMINFNVNPNTLNYDLKYQRLDVEVDPAVLWISG